MAALTPAGAEQEELASSSKRVKVDVQSFIDATNQEYERVHQAFEDQFWGTKMALKEGEFTTALLGSTKEDMEAFLRDPERLATAEELLNSGVCSEDQAKTLNLFIRTFRCYQMPSANSTSIRKSITEVEDQLSERRNVMKLGYTHPTSGAFVDKSSVGLRTTMKTSDDEAERRAAYDGLLSIGSFICANGFPEIVKLRNRLARELGYEDFYDYKVTQAEGFGKAKLFSIMDTLMAGSEDILAKARARLAEEKGASALDPWNTGYFMAGDVEKSLDPYFPFEKALENWGRSFSKMGIEYRGATMTLDLLDRPGKYSNGFCHWPQPAWVKADGSWQASTTNFTSLADPSACGSGKTALTTLMHEAGHAAHFANIVQPSPLFSQERAPTSVAYAENQSMFLDSLVSDAAWRVRYAKDRSGAVLPWDLHEADIRANHPFKVFTLRAMLAVPYFEKALYELPDDEVTAERIQALAQEVEERVQGGPSQRPLLSVPHIISDEASCYYHGYVLAEMSVFQTRKHFLSTGDKVIVDNPSVGQALTESYWRPGNGEMFLDLVEGLTGRPLTGAAWISELEKDVEAKVQSEKTEFEAALAASATTNGDGDFFEEVVELNMRVLVKDGDELIADSKDCGGFLNTCKQFESYVQNRFFATNA